MEIWYTIIKLTKLINMEAIYSLCLCVSEPAVTDLILPPWSAKLIINFFCSVFPVNVPDLICIRSRTAQKHWPEVGRMFLAHRLASGPDPFDQNLTQSARTQLDLGWFYSVWSGLVLLSMIWAGFTQYDLGWFYSVWSGPSVLWKNATESESAKLVAGRLHSARNDDSCTPACYRTRCLCPILDQAIQIGSGSRSILHNMILAFFGKNGTELEFGCGKLDQAYMIQPARWL